MIVKMSGQQTRGAITRMRIKNFMTYDDTTIEPGPNLNMILGPNGTGKSAIVCCIIVGLAGEVSLTGRGGSPADFVKKNTDVGSTEIELYNDSGKNYVVQRIITITARSQFKIDHKSEWRINDRSCLKTEVQKLTKDLNIRVDNLCQFLPQDSVTLFVKMNSCELLLNTLKAAGDQQLVVDHQKLVDLTRQGAEKRAELENLRKSFKETEVNKRRLEAEVHQLREREEYIKQKAICDQKIHHIKYLEEKAKYDESAKDVVDLKDQLKVIESQSEPFRRAIEMHKNEHKRFQDCVERSENEIKSIDLQIQQTLADIENRKQDAQEEFSKFRGKEEEERDREKTIRLKEQELESLEFKLEESRQVDCSRQLTKLADDMDEKKRETMKNAKDKAQVEDSLSRMNREMDTLRRDLEQIQAVRNKKMNLLGAKFPEARRVADWILKNTDKFSSRIFMPMMCEINVKDQKYSRLIEYIVPKQDLAAFVCQTEQDLQTLTRLVNQEMKLRINVILAPDKRTEEFLQESKQDLSQFGVKSYLNDLIDAPEPIMRYLCGTYNFHHVPVAEACSDAQVNQLLKNCQKFFVDGTFYGSSKSRYDNQTLTVTDKVRDATLLIFSLDVKRRDECAARIESLKKSMDSEAVKRDQLLAMGDKIKAEWQSLHDKHKELKSKHDEKRRLEQLIQRNKENIKNLMSEKVDVEVERRKLEQSIDKIGQSIVQTLEKLGRQVESLAKCKELQGINCLSSRLSEDNLRLAHKKFSDAQQNTNRLKDAIKVKERDLVPLKSGVEQALRKAEEKIKNYRGGKLDRETKRKFESIEEDTYEALQNKREMLSVRIQKIFNDPENSIMDQFRRQNEELKDKQMKIDSLEADLVTIDSSLDSTKKDWLPKLNEVIDAIDKNYQNFMQKLSYDGQVKLDYDLERPNKFDSYGIVIMVKYRDSERLLPLSATRQSGGERSVATMIYMLALQTKTTAPFRCVDEINQGMDKDNERKVFELLVQTADSSSSQYFLVSPKLLSNLPYSPKMKIHVVFNGKKLEMSW